MKDRRLIGAVIIGVIAVLAVVAVVAGGGEEHRDGRDHPVEVRGSELTPATLTRSTTSTTSATTTSTTSTTSTTPTTTMPVAVAPAPCATYPGNDPYFVVCGPTAVNAGDRATFDLVARGHVRDDCGSPTVEWGDGTANVACAIGCGSYPADERSIERKFEHVYADPGAYTVRFVLQGCGPDYRPQAEITMELQVK